MNLLFITFLYVLTACSSVKFMTVETYNPAVITFPSDVRKALIVNNTIPQSQVPFAANLLKRIDTMVIASGDVATVFCRTLGERIAESPYFDDVLLYEGSFRTDSFSWREAILTPADVRRLCDEQDVDVVVSLDRLLFSVEESIGNVDDFGLPAGLFLNVSVSGALCAYLPERDKPLSIIYLSDTVSSNIVPYALDPFTPEDVRYALTEAFKGLADTYYTHFVPHWREDVRWYYVSSASRNKEAAAFMAVGKWDSAAAIWTSLYRAATSWQTKARLASNLAVCSEMTGGFVDALKWAELACQHFTEGHLAGDDRMFRLQKEYLSVLTYRMEAEQTLSKQRH
jgi:hypothetical protein